MVMAALRQLDDDLLRGGSLPTAAREAQQAESTQQSGGRLGDRLHPDDERAVGGLRACHGEGLGRAVGGKGGDDGFGASRDVGAKERTVHAAAGDLGIAEDVGIGRR